jgi:hypothetical protein
MSLDAGSKGPARGGVDSLVAVVPTQAIAMRGIAAQDFLNYTRAGSAFRRLGLGRDAVGDFKGHIQSLVVRARGA